MKELNLEAGQKVWTIQLGDCEVYMIDKESTFPIRCRNIDGKIASYKMDGVISFYDYHPSLFESNPFEKSNNNKKGLTWRSPGLGENETGFLCERNKTIDFINLEEPKENKAELINALVNASKEYGHFKNDRLTLIEEKLDKILKSL